MATSIGTGLGSSWGSAVEGTWGTWTTPTKWLEYGSHTMEFKPKRIVGEGLANGLFTQRDTWRVQPTSTVEGDMKTQAFYKGLGQYFGLLMGSLTVAPVQQGSTTAYLQTHNFANNWNQSLSLQAGIPQTSGVIVQRNWRGCKMTKGEFACGVDEILECTFAFDAQGEDTTNAYATPVYQTANPVYAFNNGAFKIGAYGSEVVVEGIRKVTLAVERPMATGTYYMDGTGLKQQQVINGYTKITMDIESDYLSDAAFVAQFVGDTNQSIIWSFTSSVLAGTGFPFSLTFALPNVRWESGAPMVAGPAIIQPKLSVMALYDGSHPVATISYMSQDVAL